jgi:hypothetical protein
VPFAFFGFRSRSDAAALFSGQSQPQFVNDFVAIATIALQKSPSVAAKASTWAERIGRQQASKSPQGERKS